jgi:hypothetical protein
MNIEELIEFLQRGLRAGTLHGLGSVKIRDFSVSEEAMEAGSDGYKDLSEVLIVGDDAYLLPESGW